MNPDPKQPQRALPTLTEVINDLPPEPAVAPRDDTKVAPEPLLAAALVQEGRIVQQVIERLQARVDVLFEHRLREALAATVARMTTALADEARKELARALREAVEKAVAEEVKRQRGA